MIKLTKNQEQLKIPYGTNYRYKDYKVHETYNKNYGIESFEDNIPFSTKLKYSGYVRGRSALNIEWEDPKNKKIYYSSMVLLDYCLKNKLVNHGWIEGLFYFKKQGTSILLERYNP